MNIMEKIGFSRKGAANQNKEMNKVKMEENMNAKKLGLSDKTERKEGEKRVYNLIILDESGSMQSIYSEALTGTNETIATIRSAQKDHPELRQILTFVTFNSGSVRNDVRAIINCEDIANVNDLTRQDYRPGGCTPLLDAMGESISEMKGIVKEEDNVFVTVITDGMENSSRYYSGEMVKGLVEELTAKGWIFTYIGANQDSEDVARGFGIRNSMDFRQDGIGTEMMWEKMNSSRKAYYNGLFAGTCFGCFAPGFGFEGRKDERVTPDRVTSLEPGQIFVFGSNLDGIHSGGAAKQAYECFGAVMGQGVGLQGQSYAIPTIQGGVRTIKPYVDEFLKFADAHPELTFLVTKIGCGIAGFSPEEIAPLFAGAFALSNVYLPQEFWDVINYRFKKI